MTLARLSIVGLLSVAAGLARIGSAGDRQAPAGFDIFKPQVGRWVGTDIVTNPANGKQVHLSGHWDAKFILDDKFFSMDGAASDGKRTFTYKWIYVFDEAENRYRAWHFNSLGSVMEVVGAYNSERRELTLQQTSTGPGPRMTTVVQFEKNVVTILATGRDPKGDIVVKGKATYRRLKAEEAEQPVSD